MSSQLDNVTKLFRIRKTALEMLNDRGYLVPSVSLLISLYSSLVVAIFIYVVLRIEAQIQIGKVLVKLHILLLYNALNHAWRRISRTLSRSTLKALQVLLWTRYCYESDSHAFTASIVDRFHVCLLPIVNFKMHSDIRTVLHILPKTHACSYVFRLFFDVSREERERQDGLNKDSWFKMLIFYSMTWAAQSIKITDCQCRAFNRYSAYSERLSSMMCILSGAAVFFVVLLVQSGARNKTKQTK